MGAKVGGGSGKIRVRETMPEHDSARRFWQHFSHKTAAHVGK
jgi:hypothetical protein